MKQIQETQRRKNPCDRNSNQLRCHICKNIYHIGQNCSGKYDTLYTQEVVLYQSDFDHPEQLKTLVSESWNSAVLDSGATHTVAGEVWYNYYITSLNENEKQKIKHHTPGNTYRFGDGKLFPALQNVDIPISLGGRNIMLNTDIIASDIPLLLSRKSMKKANMTLNFKNNHAVIFDQPIQLIVTKSGHYAIPINPYKTILTNVTSGVNTNVTLVATENNKSKNDIAIKLHQQFVHPSPDKNAKIAYLSWGPMTVRQRSQEIKKFSDECAICKIYRKKPQQPVVGLPTATSFQECIAMDLKFYKGRVLLHLIDHATRLSVSSFVKSKEAIFKSWIQRYGHLKNS